MIALSCRVLALVSSVFGTSSIEIRAAIDLGHQSIASVNTVARRFNSAINAGSQCKLHAQTGASCIQVTIVTLYVPAVNMSKANRSVPW